jgi:RND family efflux transporter MFP subunit
MDFAENFVKKHKIWSVIIAVIIVAVLYFVFGRQEERNYDFITVERGTLTQEVSVTGRVKSAESVELAFEKTGKISQVLVDVGDTVSAGQKLVTLNNADLSAQLSEARAGVDAAKAQLVQYDAALESENVKLDELKRGTRTEEISIQETKVNNAEIALDDAKINLIDKIQDAWTKSDDAIRNKVDQFFNNPKGTDPGTKLLISDVQLEIDIKAGRILMETILNSWESSLGELSIASDLTAYKAEADSKLSTIKSFVDSISLVVNGWEAEGSFSQTTVNGWKSSVSTGRTNINTATINLSTASEKLKTAESALALVEQELVLKEAGATVEEISSQEAKIKQAEANVLSQKAKIAQSEAGAQNIQAQITKTVIFSPISGIITKQEAEKGEIVSANTIVVSIISGGNFSAESGSASGWEIEADIPEADIAKVLVGNNAKVTLDAHGSDIVFDTQVVQIDPAETIIEGVATYGTTLHFLKQDDRIRSGMTANIDILTNQKENVLAVPQRSVFSNNGGKFVRIVGTDKSGNEILEEKAVKVGLRGSGGTIEVLNGINEGDKVVTFIAE